jgi:hypothetical protein
VSVPAVSASSATATPGRRCHRHALALLAVAAWVVWSSSCGGSGHARRLVSSAAVFRPSPRIVGDYDADDEYGAHGNDGDNDDAGSFARMVPDSDDRSLSDDDDVSVRSLGHAAGAADTAAISRLLRRYFAAATAANGAAGCSLIAARLTGSIVESYGGSSGMAYARGTSCAMVMGKVFAHYHRQLSAHERALRRVAARIERDEGLATLSFGGLPKRQIRVAREGGVWKVDALLDFEPQ